MRVHSTLDSMNVVPHVTTKAVSFHCLEGQLLVALVALPGKDSPEWRLPETPVYNLHTSLQSLEQMLRTQCGLTSKNVRYREQLYTFETPAATPAATNTICLTYLYLSPELRWHKGDQHIGLFPVDHLPLLTGSDHDVILYARERLQSKGLYTSLPGFLLPKKFNLGAYQQVFETLTGRATDKRNFRKKLLALDILLPTKNNDEFKRGDSQLYQLRHDSLTILSKPF